MNYLIDTDIVVDYLRHEPRATEFINSQDEVIISSITFAELSYGANKSKNKKRHLRTLYELLKGSFILQFGILEAKIFGELKVDLETRGKICGDFDIAIAATALGNNSTLVTRNTKHYRNIKTLKTITP